MINSILWQHLITTIQSWLQKEENVVHRMSLLLDYYMNSNNILSTVDYTSHSDRLTYLHHLIASFCVQWELFFAVRNRIDWSITIKFCGWRKKLELSIMYVLCYLNYYVCGVREKSVGQAIEDKMRDWERFLLLFLRSEEVFLIWFVSYGGCLRNFDGGP